MAFIIGKGCPGISTIVQIRNVQFRRPLSVGPPSAWISIIMQIDCPSMFAGGIHIIDYCFWSLFSWPILRMHKSVVGAEDVAHPNFRQLR